MSIVSCGVLWRTSWCCSACVAAVFMLASPCAFAQEAPDAGVDAAPAPPPVVRAAGADGITPRREVPDYDGRGEDSTTVGDVAIWVPRVLLAPLYFVSEYVVRRPLGFLVGTAENNGLPGSTRNFFTFGPEKKAGVLPTVFVDLGFRPSFGVYAFWDDLLGRGNHLRLHLSTFGPDWVQAAVADTIPIGKNALLDIRVEGIHRPDQVFYGLGPESRPASRARYGIDFLQARPVFEATWWRSSRITVEGGVRYADFRDDACCGEPSVLTRAKEGALALPPGFQDGYTAVYERGELTIDTRRLRPAPQTGLRLELHAEQGANVRSTADSWLKYGGTLGGFVDIKNNRTVSLSVTTLFVDPIGHGATIPFTEQVVLGGSGPMRGYLYGRLIDRSAAVATFKYRWPIWVFLDGAIQAAVGNVFGPQLDDFKPALLRFSSTIGVESIGTADHTFEVLVGLGTETFASGANVSSARLLFGTNRGF